MSKESQRKKKKRKLKRRDMETPERWIPPMVSGEQRYAASLDELLAPLEQTDES